MPLAWVTSNETQTIDEFFHLETLKWHQVPVILIYFSLVFEDDISIRAVICTEPPFWKRKPVDFNPGNQLIMHMFVSVKWSGYQKRIEPVTLLWRSVCPLHYQLPSWQLALVCFWNWQSRFIVSLECNYCTIKLHHQTHNCRSPGAASYRRVWSLATCHVWMSWLLTSAPQNKLLTIGRPPTKGLDI